ncbi:MAG: hypothetical protein ABSA48_08825 [Terracidiphilus sp.]
MTWAAERRRDGWALCRIPEKKDETRMKLTINDWFGIGRWMGMKLELRLGLGLCLLWMALGGLANAQGVSTTTVQGTVYLANGQAGAGTLVVSWPAFTTANGQAVAADSTTVTIATDGFVSVNLAPNLGATPAGLYYTAVFYMSDGSTSTEYWVVPAASQASLGAVQAQVMPAAQAVQTVSKAYVDQSITELTESLLTASGGTLSGPLYLSGDPTQSLQAADKHYVDESFALAVPLAGGNMTGALTTPSVNGVQSPQAASSQTTIQEAMNAAGTNGAMEIPPAYAGTDGFTNPNGIYVTDLRQTSSQQFERSVKEFGAVCDGSTDDTNALQAALNYAQTHGVALTIPQGTCKTRALNWHGESIGGMGKQVSALMGFPGQDVLSTVTDSMNLLGYTRIHDLTIYVDQSVDVSCTPAEGRAPAGSCAVGRQMESNSIFSPGGSGLTGTLGTGAAWAVGNCAIAMPAVTGAGGNGLRVAEMENLEIATTGVDPMAAEYPGAHSTHTCGLYLAQWPQWSEFRNIDIRGLNTGIAIPALPVATPAGLNADSNRWQNITIQATHGFTAAAGSNNVLDDVVAEVGNSAATAEPPTGLVLDFAGAQQGWTVRNAVVLPAWDAVQPQLTVTAAGGAVTGVSVGTEHGLGFDPYGTQVPLEFSGSCTAQATANVNSNGSIGTISVTSGGVGCSGTTTASVNVAGSWDTAAAVNLIAGQSMTFFGGNLLKGNGGYTVWNAAGSQSYGTQLDGGGGSLPGGGSYTALVLNNKLGTAYQVDQYPGADFGAKLQACLGTLSASYGGTCDARNFTGTQSMGSNLTISTANATVLLPCATISTANQVIVTAGTRNVALRGCALRGASTASGSQGGTVFLYSGTGAMVQVGDPTYAADTMGFHMDNAVINTTAASNATAQGLAAYRTQEMDIESLYFLGNSNQTGMTLDGTGNYTGGSYFGDQFDGFQTAVNAIGHQISNPATTDWMNASTFVRLHIDCPTSGGSPIGGTYGINLAAGDGNTFTGGDVEGCSTALHLGANAQNNTIVGLRNENSNNQVVADAGSSYNNWMTGGTIFTGQLTDNGTRNSFLDTFHRSFNGMNGDWYGSQKDATVTNHWRLGIGAGNERGLLNEIQTDYGYRWIAGYSDATAGEQFYQIQDLLNNVNRLSIGQYNNGQSSTNNQTVINAAGTGSVVLNGSNNSGTGGVVFGSGGATESTVATINNAGNAQFNGTLQVGGTSTFINTPTVKNQADAEIDAMLWAGLTTSQKESFIYKDWNGNSQWYMEKDASNNWELNSATGGLDSFKAYQSTNSGDTYIDASNSSGVVRINYETGSGAGFKIYGGGSSSLYASFTGTTSIMFPGLAASSGHNCLQIDTSGSLTNTGSACGSGTGGSGTVSSGSAGQIAYYSATGTTVGGMNAVPVTAGGTGAATAAGALANLGGAPLASPTFTGTPTVPGYLTTSSASSTYAALTGAVFTGTISTTNVTDSGLTPGNCEQPGTGGILASASGPCVVTVPPGGNIQSAITAAGANGTVNLTPGTIYNVSSQLTISNNYVILNGNGACIVTTYTSGDSLVVSGSLDTLNDVCLMPGAAIPYAAIHDTSSQFGLTINRPRFVQNYPNLPSSGYYWYYNIQVDSDEDLTVNGFNAIYHAAFGQSYTGNYGTLRCDSTFCGSGIYNTAGSGNSAVGYINDSALSMGCFGNSIDWEGGNDLKLNGVILQGYNQFGLKVNSTAGGGSGNVTAIGVHNEMGGCTNPMLNGIAGGSGFVIGTGITLRMPNGSSGSGGGGVFPNSSGSTPGSENYAYYVVIHQSGESGSDTPATIPLYIGMDGNANATLGGGNGVVVTSPTSPNSGDTCDFLRIDQTVNGLVAPYSGSGLNYAIPGEQGVACGSGTYLSFTDTTPTSSLTSYTFTSYPQPYGVAIGGYGWPGADIVLTGPATNHGYYIGRCPVAGQIVVPDYTGEFNRTYITCEGPTEDGYNGNGAGYTPVLLNRQSGMNYSNYVPSATLNPMWFKYTPSGLKGLYNLGVNNGGWPWDGGPTDAITLIDSNQFKTLATPGNRPALTSADNGDSAYGIDGATGGLAERDATSISWYIDHIFDGSSYVARLTASTALFKQATVLLSGLPGLPSTGNYCLQIGSSGSVTPTGAACGAGNGSVTSVGLSLPADFNVTNTPVTSSGTLTAAWANQNANYIHAGPSSGSATTPTWRPLAAADISPAGTLSNNTTGTAAGFTGSLAGDVTGTQSATAVGRINGGSIPASANALSTNSSSQPVASTTHNLSVPANCIAASGSGTAYTCPTSPAFTPATGDHIQFKADVANTGAATLSVNGATAASIKKWGGGANLIASDLLAGNWISATFDGTYWQLEGQLGNANATEINGTAISGLSGSGSTLALTTSPVFVTPTLGAAGATSLSLTNPLTAANGGTGAATASANTAFGNFTTSSAAPSFTATTGTGSPVAAISPTFTGNTTTFANNSANTDYIVIQPGTSSTAELGGIQLNSAAATPVTEWYIEEDASYDLKIHDQGATTPVDILTGYINAGTNINSQGTSAVTINNSSSGAGTGGFIVYEGGSNYNTAAFTVTSSGNANVPGTLTAAGTITGGMGVSLSSATSIAATSFTSTGLALPAIPVSTAKRGMCVLIWEQNTAVGTVQFGMGMNNAPTDLWVINQDSPGAYKAPTYTTIASTTTTAVSAADAPSATATGYRDEIDFTLTTGSSNAVTLTVYGLSSSTSDALVIEPGSSCTWLP